MSNAGFATIVLQGGAVLETTPPVAEKEPAKAALLLAEQEDALLVEDRSSNDADHDVAITAIQSICGIVDVPVIGTGEIRRMEDVKKLIYAGCSRVALSDTSMEDAALVEEVSGKFGAERLAHLTAGGDLTELERDRALLWPDRGLQGAVAWKDLKKLDNGLVPVIVQDARTDEVLMLAYMNEEAYQKTLATGRMTYYSRSRNELWIKGETSGHYQYVRSLSADCDQDTILAKVRQIGAACHTGARSCFFNEIAKKETRTTNPQQVLNDVYSVIADRREHPREGSYTNYLFDKGIDKILKKCGEEATEIVIAAKNPGDHEIVYEISDYLYHLMVLMVEKGVTWEEIADELARRE